MAKAIIGCVRFSWLFSILWFGGHAAAFGQGIQLDFWLDQVNRGLTQAERWLEASQATKGTPPVDQPSRLEGDWRLEPSPEKRLDLLASRLLQEEYRPYDLERFTANERLSAPVTASPSDLVHGRSTIEPLPWRPVRLRHALEPWIRDLESGLRPMLEAIALWRTSVEAAWMAQAQVAWRGPLNRWQEWLERTRAQATVGEEQPIARQGWAGLDELQRIFGRTVVGRPIIEREWPLRPLEAWEQWSELTALAMRGYEVPRSTWYALESYPQARGWRDTVSLERERFRVR